LAEGSPPAGIVPDKANVAGRRGVNIACTRPALIEWVRNRASRVRRKASVCSGAFLLAEPGVLDGRRAVTHWHRCDEFAGRYPQVGLERDPIFMADGVIWTSTGVTEVLIPPRWWLKKTGRALALAVARELVVVGKRPGGQSHTCAAQASGGRRQVLGPQRLGVGQSGGFSHAPNENSSPRFDQGAV
jgi:transcriptional regulator GlxA family with amidase domain